MQKNPGPPRTSWEKVKTWYDDSVGAEGHYYHRQVILPKLLKSWEIHRVKSASVVDLACGQGVLARHLPEKVPYLGVDASKSLIQAAKEHDKNTLHDFLIADLSKPLKGTTDKFSHAAMILALQNIEAPLIAIQNAHQLLKEGGIFSIVLNHPCFRIPRQSSWGVDESKKTQYRRVDAYMSELKIPIQANPGSSEKVIETYSFHWPLSKLVLWLNQAGFLVMEMEEWCSDKVSTGSKAKMENRARNEFPLFMHIKSIRTS